MTSVQGVYPWSDVAWDLARAAGIDPDAVMAELDQLDQLDEANWDHEAVLLEQLNTGLATKLWQDLLSGAVTARDAQGKPLPHPPQENSYTGPNKPFVWVEDINGWLAKQGRIDRWEPANTSSLTPRLSRQWRQEQAVMAEITRLGRDPKAIPINRGGTGGLKSQVRHRLARNELFSGLTTFDKTWERLRAAGQIAEG